MKHPVNELAVSLFRKESLEACSEEEIRALATQYPYFVPAQLLLTRKMMQQGSEGREEQEQKTFLYFNNPLRLHQLLYGGGEASVMPSGKEASEPLPAEAAATGEGQPGGTAEPVTASATISLDELPVLPLDEPLKEQELVIDQTTEDTSSNESGKEPLVIPGLKIEPIDPVNAELAFTPYHTVDYFASLGIRNREEDRPADKFGQQLKSFTDWIKIMRRLPASELPAATDAAAEKKVEKMAEHSVSGGHAVTEAMAEVWEKQGNTQKAMDIYHKLSLLDPAKSAYFAAKIESLKKTN